MFIQAIERNGSDLSAYYYMKEANLERLHTTKFQIHGILEKAKSIETVKRLVVARD